jgi:hypothetical protein
MTTQTAAPAAPAGTGTKQAPVVSRPFITGSRFSDDFGYDQTKTLTTATQTLPDMELDTDGYTAGLLILAECTVTANTAASTATFLEDSPFAVYDTVNLKDTNNKDIFGPMNGHDAYICSKYGGYKFMPDSKASPIYAVTSGTGATGGTFTFPLYLPIEIRHRDGLGALTNKSSSSVFRLKLTLAATATVWSGTTGAPVAGQATFRTRIAQFGWMDSDMADVKGNPADPEPPGIGTIQYWDKQTFTFSSGALNQRLNSFDGGLRAMIFELRNSSLTRSGNPTDWPDPFVFNVDKTTLINRLRQVWNHLVGEDWAFRTAEVVPGVAGTPATEGLHMDNGIFPMHFGKDFGHQPGDENGFGYPWVTSATALTMKGTVGAGSASHTFNTFINYVKPASNDPKALTGGR